MSALFFSMSAAVAHADPSFVLVESQARAGDAVHFSITGGEDRVTYELEVADRDVLKGEGDGDNGAVSGQFTMPDLGAAAKSVTVEADIRDDGDDRTTVKRKLQYLGPALATAAPAEPQVAAAPAAPDQPAPGPAPAHSPAAEKTQTTEPAAVKRRAKRKRRHARKRRAERRRDTSSRSSSQKRSRTTKRDSTEKAKPGKRPAARTAPLFDGVPEPDSGGYPAGDYEESEAPKAKRAAAKVLTTPAASRVGGEPATAILIPGALGLAGFLLAGATVLRHRRKR